MAGTPLLLYKKAPFLKFLPALMAGILLQWHFDFTLLVSVCIFIAGFTGLAIFRNLSLRSRFFYNVAAGFSIAVVFFGLGSLLTYQKDIRNHKDWVGNHYQSGDAVVVTLNEPLIEKTKSFKANATVEYLIHNGMQTSSKGSILIYFKKDSLPPFLQYGSQIVFNKPLQEIKNANNPGGFDYKRYALFQGITHQVFLKENEYEIISGQNQNQFKSFIFSSREKILQILKQYIHGDKERGLAQALLIGYKNDLDQSLVQAYTNTGVVHIIAISGLHLGLIYWLLSLLTKPLKRKKQFKWIAPVFIITGLWLFALLAGAQASILRSAVMFTCIVLGQALGRTNNSIYNTLAISALLLLCINPFWLWDVGFQLSYAAVLSIVVFMRPIYNWFYFKNKAIDFLWKLNAVTLAAQVLTVPLSIYHFHQFPNYFLITNFLAVPISSLILLGEIFLCAIAFIPALANITGKVLTWLISIMNGWIEKINGISYSLWDSLHISLAQMVLLLVCIAGLSFWLLDKSKIGLKTGLISLLFFVVLRSVDFYKSSRQQKIVVYNVPQHKAIDFIDGRRYFFEGDPELSNDDFLRNFHLKPSRILHRITTAPDLNLLFRKDNMADFLGKKILMIDSSIQYKNYGNSQEIDLAIVSKNPRLYFSQLVSTFTIKQVVFDASCPAWKLTYWKRDCDSLKIPWYDVAEKGAFVMKF